MSGSGNGQLSIQASATGLSNGVYNAVVTIQAANAIPQIISVPVTFVVGQFFHHQHRRTAKCLFISTGIRPRHGDERLWNEPGVFDRLGP